MILGIHHAGFTVRDLDVSVGFYTQVLGASVISRRDVESGYLSRLTGYENVHIRQVILAVGNDQFELIQYVQPSGQPIDPAKHRPGTAHVCFRVDDLGAVHRQLVALGTRVESEPIAVVSGPNKGGLVLYAYDPDGIAIEFAQPPSA